MPRKNKKNYRDFMKTPVSSILLSYLRLLLLRLLAVAAIYGSGYWHISPIWFFIIWGLIKYRDQKRLERRFSQKAATAIAFRNKRQLVLANVDSLPSWVYYPDNERCEWLNRLINQIWVSFKILVLDQLKQLEPDISRYMEEYRKGLNFKFVDVGLGSLTPRITGIKVFGQEFGNVNSTIMDIHMFYVSDGRINCSFWDMVFCGVEQLQIEGCLRIMISSPDASSPPALEVFFLQLPKLKFNLTGVGIIADCPVIEGYLRSAVNKSLSDRVVLPNKYIINYNVVEYEEFIFPEPEGILKIEVIEAKALGGTQQLYYSSTVNPDPFAIIIFGSKTLTTPTVKNSMDPVWSFAAEFVVNSFFDDVVTISVEDEKHVKPLGQITLGVNLVEEKTKFKSWLQLEDVKSGMLHLCISYHNLEIGVSNDLPVIVEVFIDDVKNLTSIKGNIYVEVSLGDATQLSRSVPVYNPVFRESFVFHLKTPETDKMLMRLIKVEDNETLGNAEFGINQLLKETNNEVINKQIKIKGSDKTSTLSVSMRLRTLLP